MSFKFVLNTCPDLATAHTIAEELLELNLAACVNLIPNVVSLYKWQGKIEQSAEVQLFIKTDERKWPELRSYIEQNHPYDVPEILALDITDGNQSYFAWLSKNLNNENS